jgi:hypothetical protein
MKKHILLIALLTIPVALVGQDSINATFEKIRKQNEATLHLIQLRNQERDLIVKALNALSDGNCDDISRLKAIQFLAKAKKIQDEIRDTK